MQSGRDLRARLAKAERLASLHSYEIRDSMHETAFDALTRQAAELCETPSPN